MKAKGTLIILIIAILFNTTSTLGEEINTAATENKILFLIDCSQSMNANDREMLAPEIVRLFADAYFENTEIGVLFYNDSILKNFAPVRLNAEENREEIKRQALPSVRKGNTDIGMALKVGMEQFTDKNTRNAIVLFSDGETDLSNSSNRRTIQDSYNDQNAAMAKAKEVNCRIYTVGMNRTGRLSSGYLQEISDYTGGKSYLLNGAEDMNDIFNSIYQSITKEEIYAIPSSLENGQAMAEVPLPAGLASSSSIVLLHKGAVSDVKIDVPSSVREGKYYTVVHINKHTKDTAKLSFQVKDNAEITISAMSNVNIVPAIEEFENTALLHVPVNVKLYNKNSKEEVASKIYKKLGGEVTVIDLQSGEKQKLALGSANDCLTATFVDSNPKKYSFAVDVTGAGYHKAAKPYEVLLTNTMPYADSEENIKVLKQDNEKNVDLDSYFTDDDGDSLTYSLSGESKKNARIDKNMLVVTADKEGAAAFGLTVSDGRGGILETVVVLDVMPFWVYYKNVTIGLFLGIALLIGAYLLFFRKKEKIQTMVTVSEEPSELFSGVKFEGYFMNTFSGNEIPVLNWNTSYLNNRTSISLAELFNILDVEEKLPEAEKILFKAGKNGTIVLKHNTNCIISIRNREIPKGKREVLHYDDRLYIVFEDNVTEIEIRCKRASLKH